MGRPINPNFIGNPATPGRVSKALILSQAWIPGAAGLAVGTVYILRQVGTGRYQVTDGTHTGVVRLVNATPTIAGQAIILVTPFGGGAAQHARVINNRSVKTWEDHSFEWNPNVSATASGQANLPVLA